MKQYLSRDGNAATISTHPIEINGNECEEINITNSQKNKIEEGKHTFEVNAQKKIIFTKIPESPIKILREELKRKIEDGTATQQEKDEALILLL